ncbi:TIGR03086 family metal-binding protein [Streptomyces sp. NBC_01304]|uniref:TIGR03086 family metal-binding protein n=1 Tax=Streptomyces sp. NBC_01304 TaxID=2903818 RepID=UPI002E1595DA|nr:TIGR03086 family metal-binding protein [Streptomyces sp. NBC_01304]
MAENGTTGKWQVLDAAHGALRAVVRGIPVDRLDAPTPCAEWNVTQVLQHAAGDQIGYAAFLTGGPGPAENPFEPSGKLADTPEAVVEAALTASFEAWETVDPAAEQVGVPLPPHSMTPALGVGACALDAAVHAWDIAVATGQPSPLTDELARELLPVAHATVEAVRAFAFAPALAEQAGEGEAARLLRYLGRRPDWASN